MERPIGAPCWIDLLTSDASQARDFYNEILGWSAGEPSEQYGGYFMFMRDGVPMAGCMQHTADAPGMEGPNQWGVYLSTTDVKATVEKAAAGGGSLRVGPMDIDDLGTEAIVADNAGVRIGAWQANIFPGLSSFAEPGAAVLRGRVRVADAGAERHPGVPRHGLDGRRGGLRRDRGRDRR